ncbi:DUF305 domain-containing protein [Nocardioides sp. IC4_145]|uniref:DUF305 domain-containing protein n=1 Tax=Nocardioides sp. IC4_145 TaxID=2714037 RepID=UPI0014098B88|nr:DUF305 domain-containing protein [Nocardioides sp. IC4_145]NHC22928.1 DUF305 domain-containing protein [Nocardioides sp. IC4_145]
MTFTHAQTHAPTTQIRRGRAVRRGATALSALALSVTLAACGDKAQTADPSVADPSATQTASNGEVFNRADVDFATKMIPHHAQAVEMALMAQARDLSPEVAQLADDIRDAQVPEVETMTDWLTAWDQEIPETSLDHANAGHDWSQDSEATEGDEHSGHEMSGDASDDSSGMSSMPGMMSAEDMNALKAASDEEFEDMWLEMMIEHHTGAIEMAQAEQESGLYPDAIALAETIEADQEREIAVMEELLS